MNIDLNLRFKLFREYLENGGIEKIVFPNLLQSLKSVRWHPNGNVIPETLNSSVRAAMNAYVGSQLTPSFVSDTYISSYRTLLEKSIFFEQTVIDEKEDLDKIIEEFSSRKKVLFRGLNDAKYRLYSSLQRYWVSNKLAETTLDHQVFLVELVQNTRDELKLLGKEPKNDIEILSFLQHYGCPTPLLDWTYSFDNALFFSISGVNQPFGSTWEIDNYISVYYLEEEYLTSASYRGLMEESLEANFDLIRPAFINRYKELGIEEEVADKILTREVMLKLSIESYSEGLIPHMTSIDKLKTFPLIYFSDSEKDSLISFGLHNNQNIINQQGVFTWNANPTRPLEHISNEEHKKDFPDEDFRFSKCITIHKNLVDHIQKRLNDLSIVDNYIYPEKDQEPWRSVVKGIFSKTIQTLTDSSLNCLPLRF